MATLSPSQAVIRAILDGVRQDSFVVGDCLNEVNTSDVQIWRENFLAKATMKVNELASYVKQIRAWLSHRDKCIDGDTKFQLRLHEDTACDVIQKYSNCARFLNMSLFREEGWSGRSEGQIIHLNQDVLDICGEMDYQDQLAAFDDECLVNMAAAIMVLMLPFLWLIS